MSAKKEAARTLDHELTLVRVFDAPRKIVFEAWTNPKHLAEWWGPAGFTTTMNAWEAKKGGHIHIAMNAPNGEVYPMGGTFIEVKPPGKIEFTASALNPKGEAIFENLTTVLLEETGGKTTLTLRTKVLSMRPEAAQYLAGQKKGWSQSLVRLEALVTAKAK
jgi:uncharacterized protein YndB with AHSA1/START domain